MINISDKSPSLMGLCETAHIKFPKLTTEEHIIQGIKLRDCCRSYINSWEYLNTQIFTMRLIK